MVDAFVRDAVMAAGFFSEAAGDVESDRPQAMPNVFSGAYYLPAEFGCRLPRDL